MRHSHIINIWYYVKSCHVISFHMYDMMDFCFASRSLMWWLERSYLCKSSQPPHPSPSAVFDMLIWSNCSVSDVIYWEWSLHDDLIPSSIPSSISYQSRLTNVHRIVETFMTRWMESWDGYDTCWIRKYTRSDCIYYRYEIEWMFSVIPIAYIQHMSHVILCIISLFSFVKQRFPNQLVVSRICRPPFIWNVISPCHCHVMSLHMSSCHVMLWGSVWNVCFFVWWYMLIIIQITPITTNINKQQHKQQHENNNKQ